MILKFLAWVVGLLSWRTIYFLSDALAGILPVMYRRKLVNANLKKAFPDLSATELRKTRRQCYVNLTDLSLETLKAASLSADELSSRVHLKDTPAVEQLRQHNGPFLLYASHYCNWEWIALGGALHLAPVDPIYKPLSDRSADLWMNAYRAKVGNVPIHIDKVGKELRKDRGFRSIGVVADQAPSKGNKGKVWAPFFDVPSPFYKGVFALPFLTQWPAFYASLERIQRGHYALEILPMGSPPYEKRDLTILKTYIEYSEREIRRSPGDWLWTHNRWKYEKRDNEELLIFRS